MRYFLCFLFLCLFVRNCSPSENEILIQHSTNDCSSQGTTLICDFKDVQHVEFVGFYG